MPRQPAEIRLNTTITGTHMKGKPKTVKLEALEKATATACDQARRLEQAAQQAGAATRAAKDKARQAKARLKLAKREAKQSRQAAKEAKRAFTEALLASEKAAAKAASLEKKLQKSRPKGPPVHAKMVKPAHAPAHKRVAAKPHTAAGKPSAVKPPPRPASRAKPPRVLASESARPATSGWEANVQVPRDLAPRPAVSPSQSHVAAPPSADKSS